MEKAEKAPGRHTNPLRLEDLPDACTVEDVAAFLRIHTNSVYEAIKRKEIQAFKIGRRFYISKTFLENKLRTA